MSEPRVVVLVEGESDRVALHTLASAQGRALSGIEVVALHGITNLRAHAVRLGPLGAGLPLAGLYDAPEAPVVRRGLAAAQVASGDDLTAAGFFRCTDDLEDELVRALGPDAVEAVIATEGETRSLDLLAQMPAQRGWTREALLHRFIGVRAGRKARYAALLTEALDPTSVPIPLVALLDHVEALRAGGKASLRFVAEARGDRNT